MVTTREQSRPTEPGLQVNWHFNLAGGVSAAYVYPSGIYIEAMMVAKSTIFKTNRSQAVRLPKEVAFPDDVHRVEVFKMGEGRLIVPEGKRWSDFFAKGPRASEDFMNEREQPDDQEREPL